MACISGVTWGYVLCSAQSMLTSGGKEESLQKLFAAASICLPAISVSASSLEAALNICRYLTVP